MIILLRTNKKNSPTPKADRARTPSCTTEHPDERFTTRRPPLLPLSTTADTTHSTHKHTEIVCIRACGCGRHASTHPRSPPPHPARHTQQGHSIEYIHSSRSARQRRAHETQTNKPSGRRWKRRTSGDKSTAAAPWQPPRRPITRPQALRHRPPFPAPLKAIIRSRRAITRSSRPATRHSASP